MARIPGGGFGLESIGGGGGQAGTFGKTLLTGDEELERKLRKLPKAVRYRILPQAVKFAGRRPRKLMRDKMRTREDTGAVRKSIDIKIKTYPSGNTVAVIGPRKTVSRGEMKGGILYHPSTTKYKFSRLRGKHKGGPQQVDKVALAIERGWRGRTPFPFMRKSFEETKPHVVKDFQLAIGNKIEKLAKKL